MRPVCFSPNGLLPNEVAYVTQPLDRERWSRAEERTGELIDRIQPNQISEEHRNSVATYVQRLIVKCFPCKVFTFGSVPLKTYLPDGDIDLTAVSTIQDLKETWANDVRDILEGEAKSDSAEFHVKEVHYVKAEVKIIKCLIDNIVVDVSFNQLGGLSTLFFLDEVDKLINHNHLYKRSIILIKAWCYYEGRILGAPHGLISTYALETLVLYIFHVFNNTLSGPLEVLYRFLELFSKFDWDKFSLSLWGPVPLNSLPDMTAEPPRMDGVELSLSKMFHDTCNLVNAACPRGYENLDHPFVSKHFNIIDPLRTNNNLGRSVSKGNLFRIRSAFAFGARELSGLLDCPHKNLISEVDRFFKNTWNRHEKGHRPDAPNLFGLGSINSNQIDRCASSRKYSGSKKPKEVSVMNESDVHLPCSVDASFYFRSQYGNNSVMHMPATRSIPAFPHCTGKDAYASIISPTASNIKFEVSQKFNAGSKSLSGYPILRTNSSLNLSMSNEESPERHNLEPATENRLTSSTRSYDGSRRNLTVEALENQSARLSDNDDPPTRQRHSSGSVKTSTNPKHCSNKYDDDPEVLYPMANHNFIAERMQMHQEIHDLVESFDNYSLNRDVVPISVVSANPSCSVASSLLVSPGRSRRSSPDIPSKLSSFNHMHDSQGLVPFPGYPYVQHVGVVSDQEDTAGSIDSDLILPDLNQVNYNVSDSALHPNQHFEAVRGPGRHHRSFQVRHESTSIWSNSVHSSQVSSSDSELAVEGNELTCEKVVKNRQDYGISSAYTSANSRYKPAAQTDSLRIDLSSDYSLDRSRSKKIMPVKDRGERKSAPSTNKSAAHGLGKAGMKHDIKSIENSHLVDDDNTDWIPLSATDVELNGQVLSTVGVPGHELPTMNGWSSALPVGSGTEQRVFYPTGPPVPFLTMLPIRGLSTEELNNYRSNALDHNMNATDNLDQLKVLYGSKSRVDSTPTDSSGNFRSDILHSDLASHWQNLQYVRFNQDAPQHYPSPVVLPPIYPYGFSPSENPRTPLSDDMTLLNQLMRYTPHSIPLPPLQPGSSRHAGGDYQACADKSPRYRGGTGLYLPNSRISSRGERQYSNGRSHRGNYSYGRKGYNGYKEGSWNNNTKP